MRASMRMSPAAFAEGLGAWLVSPAPDLEPGPRSLHLEAAEVAAQTVSEILLLVAKYVTGGKWS